MPFPWKKKKNRVTRISQFVADFQSPQRTSSLVVQTGFPTSLIDLFAKNRIRFKNSTFNKPVRSEIIDPSSSPSPPPPPPPSPVTTPPSVSESPIHDAFSEEILNPLIGENTDDGAGDVAPVNKRRSSFRSKSIIVKILTVIILAASVKELTVAITVSAFALLFLENALKRVVSFLKPCSNVFVSIESLFQKIPLHLKAKPVHKPVLNDGEIELLNLNSNLDLNCCVNDEIEVVEEKSELGICRELEDSSVKEIVEEKYMKERIQFRSRSGRFKATMVKKLQKFRSFKREKKEEEKGNQCNNVRLEASNNKENEIESCSDVSSVMYEEEDKQEVKNEIVCGINCTREESIIVVGNSSYAILIIIALIGLIVGRLQALFLTIGWCLLVKMVRSIWRSKNVSSLDGVKLGGLDH